MMKSAWTLLWILGFVALHLNAQAFVSGDVETRSNVSVTVKKPRKIQLMASKIEVDKGANTARIFSVRAKIKRNQDILYSFSDDDSERDFICKSFDFGEASFDESPTVTEEKMNTVIGINSRGQFSRLSRKRNSQRATAIDSILCNVKTTEVFSGRLKGSTNKPSVNKTMSKSLWDEVLEMTVRLQ